MADQIRRYKRTGLGFDLANQLAPGGLKAVGAPSAQPTIDVTVDDQIQNVAEDCDAAMTAAGWTFTGIV